MSLAAETLSEKLQKAVKCLHRNAHGAPKVCTDPSRQPKTSFARVSRLLLTHQLTVNNSPANTV